jgi:hypothetical protein
MNELGLELRITAVCLDIDYEVSLFAPFFTYRNSERLSY